MTSNQLKFYVTTFCNFPHVLKTGRPIGHECYILNPKVLQVEARDGAEAALALGLPLLHRNQIVNGRKFRS